MLFQYPSAYRHLLQSYSSSIKMAFTSEENKSQYLYIAHRAARKIKELSLREPTHALNILVQVGGCHGFQYHFSWELVPSFSNLDFTNPSLIKPDLLYYILPKEYHPGRIMIDQATLKLIDGSTLDYSQEIIGAKFVMIDNPNADAGCGCGISFGPKEI